MTTFACLELTTFRPLVCLHFTRALLSCVAHHSVGWMATNPTAAQAGASPPEPTEERSAPRFFGSHWTRKKYRADPPKSHHPTPSTQLSTFDGRRQQVLERRRAAQQAHVREIESRWESHDDAVRAREHEEELAALAAQENVLSPYEAWLPPLLVVVHFMKALKEEAEMIRATTNLRFFFAPLCGRYLQRLRRRLALRRAVHAASDAGQPIVKPTVQQLRASSKVFTTWPDKLLVMLLDRMELEFFGAKSYVFLSGEPNRAAKVHYLVQGFVTVDDLTEQPGEYNDPASRRQFGSLNSSVSGDPQSPRSGRPSSHIFVPGYTFGENAALMSENFRDSFFAKTDCITFSASTTDFNEIARRLPATIMADVLGHAKARFKRRMHHMQPSIDELRGSHVFFAGWPNEAIHSCLDSALAVTVKPGERIFRDHRTTNRIFFLQCGAVHLMSKNETRKVIESGTTLGTSSIIPTTVPYFGEEIAAVAVTYAELWSFAREEVANTMHRYRMTERVLGEYTRNVKPAIPRPSVDSLRKIPVFTFLPDRAAAALAEALQPVHLKPGAVLARQDLVVTDLVITVWGTLQLLIYDGRSGNKKAIGDLYTGVSYGAAEVIAQATSSVTVMAPDSTIVWMCSRDAVYAVLDLAGHNVFMAILDKANQVTGSRSAGARARIEEELRDAKDKRERQTNPEQKTAEAAATAALRVAQARKMQRAAELKDETRELRQQKQTIHRLTTEAMQAREIQKLTVEHRVFACIKNQVYGGRRNEHTDLVSQYYAVAVDEFEPSFTEPDKQTDLLVDKLVERFHQQIPDVLPQEKQVHPETSVVFALDEEGNLVTVDAHAAPATETLRSTSPPSSSRHEMMHSEASSSVQAPASFITETGDVSDAVPQHPTALQQALLVSDPMPTVKPPPKPAQLTVLARPDDQARRDRMDLLHVVEERSRRRREEYQQSIEDLFAPPLRSGSPRGLYGASSSVPHPGPRSARSTSATHAIHDASDLDSRVRAGSLPPMPKSSRLAHEVGVDGPDPSVGIMRGPPPLPGPPVVPRQPAVTKKADRSSAPPKTQNPPLCISVDMWQASRTAGARPVGKLAKGPAGQGVVPRVPPPPPLQPL
jgi:CRP-like cAMP-binding protein